MCNGLVGTKKSKKTKEKEVSAEADSISTASSSCVSLDSIPSGPDSTPALPDSSAAGSDSTAAGSDSTPASVSLDAQWNGGVLVEYQQDSSEVATKESDDGVWTDSDLLGTDGGLKYEEEGLEGAWHSGDEEGRGNVVMNISFDSDVGLGKEVGGAEEWDVDSTLTGHMIDDMKEEDVTGQMDRQDPDASYLRLLENHVEGGAEGAEHHREEQDNISTGYDLQDRIDANHDLQDRLDASHTLQDTVDIGRNLQDTIDISHDLQDRQELLDRHDTLVAEDQEAVAHLNPFTSSPSASPPLSPTNPFVDATPPARGNSAGSNPFLRDCPEPSNPFLGSSATPTLESHTPVATQPLNPFLLDSAHNSPPILSTNPFDIDDHAHTEVELPPPPRPSPPAPNVPPILAIPPTPSDEHDFPGDDADSDIPTLPDILPLPLLNHAPQSFSSSSPEPLPKFLRPGSASTTRSHTTDDRESYSGSSIDLSVLMDTTPSGCDSPSHLTSPEENFFASEVRIEIQ